MGAGFRGYGGDLEAVERMSQWRGDEGKGIVFFLFFLPIGCSSIGDLLSSEEDDLDLRWV